MSLLAYLVLPLFIGCPAPWANEVDGRRDEVQKHDWHRGITALGKINKNCIRLYIVVSRLDGSAMSLWVRGCHSYDADTRLQCPRTVNSTSRQRPMMVACVMATMPTLAASVKVSGRAAGPFSLLPMHMLAVDKAFDAGRTGIITKSHHQNWIWRLRATTLGFSSLT